MYVCSSTQIKVNIRFETIKLSYPCFTCSRIIKKSRKIWKGKLHEFMKTISVERFDIRGSWHVIARSKSLHFNTQAKFCLNHHENLSISFRKLSRTRVQIAFSFPKNAAIASLQASLWSWSFQQNKAFETGWEWR